MDSSTIQRAANRLSMFARMLLGMNAGTNGLAIDSPYSIRESGRERRDRRAAQRGYNDARRVLYRDLLPCSDSRSFRRKPPAPAPRPIAKWIVDRVHASERYRKRFS